MNDKQAHAEEQVIEADQALIPILEGLRDTVDNIGKQPLIADRNGVFRPIDVNAMITSIQYSGVEIGYRLHMGRLEGYKCVPDPDILTREIVMRFEQPLVTIPDDQQDPIVLAVFDVFLEQQQGEVSMETFLFGSVHKENRLHISRLDDRYHDCHRFTQEFSPLILMRTSTAHSHIKIDDDIDKVLLH